MRTSLLACTALFFAGPIFAQPVIGGTGYSSSIPYPVAPGQLITLFVQGTTTQLTSPARASTNPLPTTLAGVSIVYRGEGASGNGLPVPILDVRPISTCNSGNPAGCGTMLAVTVQMPFEMQPLCPICGQPVLQIPSQISVSVNGVTSALYQVQALNDQVHILTVCDIVAGAAPQPESPLPCPPVVAHADGTMVNAASPAQSGEELVAYALGLGQTSPAQTDGLAPSAPAQTQYNFGIDFNYRPNALATKPLGPTYVGVPSPIYPTPLFTGATPGFAGLYQINFVVPAPPAGTLPCTGTFGNYANVVQSNLTVSVGSAFSFDGAGICVDPGIYAVGLGLLRYSTIEPRASTANAMPRIQYKRS